MSPRALQNLHRMEEVELLLGETRHIQHLFPWSSLLQGFENTSLKRALPAQPHRKDRVAVKKHVVHDG